MQSIIIKPDEQGDEIKADRFNVQSLMEDLPPLETIGAKRPVREALAKMCARNYSQLVVMKGRICIGSVTLESILCQLGKEDLKGNSALEFMNWPVRRFIVENTRFVDPDDDILKHVEWMAEKGFVIVSSHSECKAIVTNYDLVHFFTNWTEVFLLLREIETNLRFIVSQCLKGSRLRKALGLIERRRDPPPSSINDLSFDELRQLIHKNWKKFKHVFLDEQKTDLQLRKIRDLRNGIFHFRTETTKHELASIKRFRDNCLKIANSLTIRAPKERMTKKRTGRMSKRNMRDGMSIEKTYESVQQNVPHNARIDSLEVVKQVEEYRQFWKPETTNVVLLAESHVYTDERDFEMKCNRLVLHKIIPAYPLRFVRFVYCLGYGESELLNRVRSDRKNTGTPQYWKIFSSCVAESEKDLSFWRVLKTGTSSLYSRLRNKVSVLRKMKRRGIWLLDASIVGLYGSGKKDYSVTERVLEICWRNAITDTIEESNPKHIIVVGKGVGNILNQKLHRLNIPFSIIPQPQARGTSEWQLENYKKYQRICAKHC